MRRRKDAQFSYFEQRWGSEAPWQACLLASRSGQPRRSLQPLQLVAALEAHGVRLWSWKKVSHSHEPVKIFIEDLHLFLGLLLPDRKLSCRRSIRRMQV